jgi:uncharacterized protein (TIGR04255 family)
MGTRMRHAPVFYTLAQVIFSPVMQMGDYVPKLQERLRHEGFPDFEALTQQRIALKVNVDEGSPQVTTEQGPRTWSFQDAGKTAGYLLQPNALVYHTTAYETFDVFSRRLVDGLRLVHELVGLSFIERIGLRYVDAVVARHGEKLSQYLNSGVLGLSELISGKLSHSFTELATTSNDGTLVARVLVTEGELAIPPDLFPIKLKLDERFAGIKGRHAVLDTDHFAAERFEFDIKRVGANLMASHARIADAFRLAATDHARKMWNGGGPT